MPSDRLDKDVDLIQKAGITVVRVGESTWSSWEPPDGDFSVSYSYGNGTDLLTSNSVSRGNAVKLNPWDLAIVEDQ